METKTIEFLNGLKQAGFEYLEGKYQIGDPTGIYETGGLPDANDFNVGHPYMICTLPSNPKQDVLNNTPVRRLPSESDESGQQWATYRLKRDEAMVFVGRTPPNVDYFSFRSYLFWRFYPEQCKIKKTFSSLGDTINNTNILANHADSPYNQQVVIISTASRTTYQSLHDQMVSSGIPKECINRDEIPASLLKMGIEQEKDQIMFLCRFGNFNSELDKETYLLNKDNSSGRVFRVTPTKSLMGEAATATPSSTLSSVLAEDCYAPRYKPRGSGNPQTNELKLLPAINALRQGILERHCTSHQPEDLTTRIWIFEGTDAIQQGIDAYGEDRDTTYLRSDPFQLKVRDDEFAIVYGLNHHAFGKVIYNSFGVYDSTALSGVCSVSSAEQEFSGGAAGYLEGTEWEQYAHLFYVWRISRIEPEDKERRILNVPYQWQKKRFTSAIDRASIIPVDQTMFVGFRAYMDKETNVGPAWWEMIYDRVIKFTPYECL